MDSKIIEYVHKIAECNESPSIEQLQEKYNQSWLDFRQTWIAHERGEKSQWQILRKAADVYFWSIQIEERSGRPEWAVTWPSVRLHVIDDDERFVIAAAHAIYGWIAENPSHERNEEQEIALIQKAVEALSLKKGAPRGNQYAKKPKAGRTIGLYITGHELLNIENILRARKNGEEPTQLEIDGYARTLFKFAAKQDHARFEQFSEDPEIAQETP